MDRDNAPDCWVGPLPAGPPLSFQTTQVLGIVGGRRPEPEPCFSDLGEQFVRPLDLK